MQNKVEKKWAAYVAGVAGVVSGVSAHGAVISRDVNLPFTVDAPAANVDFNTDGVVDYQILRGRQNGDATQDYVDLKQGVDAGLASTNRFVRDGATDRIASLAAGTEIGPGSDLDTAVNPFVAATSVNLYDERKTAAGPGPSGNFNPDNIVGNPEYIGVRFKLGGAGIDYYGYLAIDITNATDLTGAITGYGYEDTGLSILAGAVGGPAFVRGDFNFDGGVDASDIDPFVLAANEGDPFAAYIASAQAAFSALYPGQTLNADVINQIGDINGDGGLDSSDIDPFVPFANNGGSLGAGAIPEPSGLAVLALGAAVLVRRKGR